MIPFYLKLIIFLVLLIVAYFVLRQYDLDPLVALGESIQEMEWNMTAVVLTLLFSAFIWVILWKTPWWATTYGGDILDVTGLPAKLFLTLGTPVFGYPLAVRSLNRE